MGRQFIAMRMGMGIMPVGERRFHLRMVRQVGLEVIHRVVSGCLFPAFLVLAGM
jgi:hypothetical protein